MNVFLIVFGCNNDQQLKPIDIATDAAAEVVFDLTLTEPQYGAFYGDDDIPVSGTVSPADATLLVEGSLVTPDENGYFELSLPFSHDYEIVDVRHIEADLRERIPVFSGNNPMDTWPGGITARLLPQGLTVLGETIGAMIDETGWSDTISDQLPETEWGTGGFRRVGLVHDATVVALSPAEDGVAVDFTLNNVGIEYELWSIDWMGIEQTVPVYLIFEEVAIGATAIPYLDDDGILIFSLVEADVTMGTPDIQLGYLDGVILEWLLTQSWDWVVEPISELILDAVLTQMGELEVGGPFAFETDLMGAPMAIELYDVYGDLDGLALGLEMQIGDLAEADPSDMPVPTEDDAPDVQLAVGIHEGLFQALLSDQLLGLLTENMDMINSFGAILGNAILALPGGDQVEEEDGWCIAMDPGSLSLVRMKEGIAPLANLYLPDFIYEVGIDNNGNCEEWLKASFAMEIHMNVEDGSVLAMDFEIAEGALLYYGAEGVSEAEVIPVLSSSLEGLFGLVGGFAQFDLADMLGGDLGDSTGLPLGDLQISIVDSRQLTEENGDFIEGLFALSMDLWATE